MVEGCCLVPTTRALVPASPTAAAGPCSTTAAGKDAIEDLGRTGNSKPRGYRQIHEAVEISGPACPAPPPMPAAAASEAHTLCCRDIRTAALLLLCVAFAVGAVLQVRIGVFSGEPRSLAPPPQSPPLTPPPLPSPPLWPPPSLPPPPSPQPPPQPPTTPPPYTQRQGCCRLQRWIQPAGRTEGHRNMEAGLCERFCSLHPRCFAYEHVVDTAAFVHEPEGRCNLQLWADTAEARPPVSLRPCDLPATSPWATDRAGCFVRNEVGPPPSRDPFCVGGRQIPSLFLIGAQKCGTTSLGLTMLQLGFRGAGHDIVHQPWAGGGRCWTGDHCSGGFQDGGFSTEKVRRALPSRSCFPLMLRHCQSLQEPHFFDFRADRGFGFYTRAFPACVAEDGPAASQPSLDFTPDLLDPKLGAVGRFQAMWPAPLMRRTTVAVLLCEPVARAQSFGCLLPRRREWHCITRVRCE